MPVGLIDGSINIIRLSMTPEEFPEYLAKGINADPTTQNVEQKARNLIENDFRDDLTASFVKSVCRWGNYAGVAGKVLKHNDLGVVSKTLRKALEQTETQGVQLALRTTLGIRGLAVSFASKHLKFLNPERHVVLDSIISENLGYPRDENGEGYAMFVSDCAQALKIVKEKGVPYPASAPAKEWRIADVEMAIFQKIRAGK